MNQSDRRRHAQRLGATVLISMLIAIAAVGCSADDDGDINPIPSDNSTLGSGLPTTDGSTITTPAPNPDAGGGGGTP